MISNINLVCTALVASGSLFTTVNGHMMLANPVPYGKSTLDTSPILADGSNFPCKQRTGVYEVEGASNKYSAGDEIPISFSGSASHGGGSCQFAITTDKAPTVSTKWQVIHSIIGGCPIKGADGNGGSDNYTITLPADVPAGDYTFAWTWLNRIGNREMYMNCAPLTVEAGSATKRSIEARKESPLLSKKSQVLFGRDNATSSYPDFFLANICNNKCVTKELDNVDYPDPGPHTDNYGGSQTSIKPTCSCAAADIAATVAPSGGSSGSSGSGAGSGQAGSGSGSGASVMTTAATVPTSAPAAGSASSGTGAGGILSTAVATATMISTAEPAAQTGASTGNSSSSGLLSGSNSTSSTTASGQTCDSGIVCSADGTQFGLCNGSQAVAMQAVASGTKCVGGNIVSA